MRVYYKIAIMVLLTQLSGCGIFVSMKTADDQNIPPLTKNKSRLVLMRSAFHGAGLTASIYEVVNDSPRFLSVVNNDDKIYIDTTPGTHTYMSLGVNVRFLIAHMEAGKTYYAMVQPRGWPGVNYNLRPFRSGGTGDFVLDSKDFNDWYKKTTLVVTTPEVFEWSKGKEDLLNARFEKEWPIWNSKPPMFRQQFTLMKSDGK